MLSRTANSNVHNIPGVIIKPETAIQDKTKMDRQYLIVTPAAQENIQNLYGVFSVILWYPNLKTINALIAGDVQRLSHQCSLEIANVLPNLENNSQFLSPRKRSKMSL